MNLFITIYVCVRENSRKICAQRSPYVKYIIIICIDVINFRIDVNDVKDEHRMGCGISYIYAKGDSDKLFYWNMYLTLLTIAGDGPWHECQAGISARFGVIGFAILNCEK